MALTTAPNAELQAAERQTDWAGFSQAIRGTALTGIVDESGLARALYSSDASLYRVAPQAVARPRDAEQLHQILRLAREHRVPITSRGSGTSCAGNAVGPGLVIDFRAGLNRILAIDPRERTARVQPGVVQADLQQAVRPYGLRFGPDPSTHTRCTIGGMIGNNACGPRALGYGKTASNVLGLTLITGTGETLAVGATGAAAPSSSPTLDQLRRLVRTQLATIRTNFGTFDRQVSGYSLEHLLPENGFAVQRFLAGTEGTLGAWTEATVRLVADAPFSIMVALGYPSMPEAADDIPAILPHRPTAAEGLDRRIVDVVRRHRGDGAVPPLPAGDGWIFVELVDDDEDRLCDRGAALLRDAHAMDGQVVTDRARAQALWKIREDGAGLAQVSLGAPAYPGWEDAAVRPERLGAYLRDFDQLLAEHDLQGLPYGHFGDGCLHCRIDFPLTTPGGTRRYRSFIFDAARLATSYGGSMSGEHGDGRARSELLPIMYNEASLAVMAQVKSIFDPENLMNPGVLVDPVPIDQDIRAATAIGMPLALVDPDFASAVHRCSGVGKCVVADRSGTPAVMCPSYQATGNEKDSTRGRARVLQEMINGSVISGGWRSAEVHEALDLCLSCKGCRRDCPTGTDMARFKATVLDRAWAGRLRPRSHYALGWLPRWARMITAVPGLAVVLNSTGRMPGVSDLLKWGAGVDRRRPLPRFAGRTARSQARRRTPSAGKPVVVWVDSFSDTFAGSAVAPVLRLLDQAGYAPQVLQRTACCGLTWISTGQLDGARAQLRRSLDVLYPLVSQGIPVVGLEPSCLAVWRSDAAELLPDDARVAEVADGVRTIAELLAATPDWSPPRRDGMTVVAQPHCHQASVTGFGPDLELLRRTGATVTTLGGCCGLAGNFGVERGHFEVSKKVAEQDLLPALEQAPDAVFLADGFSCRLQAEQLAGRQAVTLAELLLR